MAVGDKVKDCKHRITGTVRFLHAMRYTSRARQATRQKEKENENGGEQNSGKLGEMAKREKISSFGRNILIQKLDSDLKNQRNFNRIPTEFEQSFNGTLKHTGGLARGPAVAPHRGRVRVRVAT